MTNRNVGGMAEAELERWSHQVGITPNKVIHDKEGWDYFLQFPFETNTLTPTLDQRSTRIECLIQVKGTDTTKKQESISLSNWERLVKSPLPAFFLVINYSSNNQPVSAHLIHIGKQWIESVLHRLRKLSSGEEQNLNLKTLNLKWTKTEQLSSFDGEGLKKAILSYLNLGMEENHREKLEIRKNAGEPISALLEFTTTFNSEDEFWNSLVDFAIGLTDSIPISKTILKEDVRFGIPASIKQEEGEGILSITKQPVVECNVTFKNSSNTLISTLPANFHAPYWFFKGREIPKANFKQRVVFEIGDAIIRPFNREANINFKFAQASPKKSIVDHANLWRIALIVSDVSGFTIEINGKDGVSFGSGKITSLMDSNSLDKELLEIARNLDNAYFIARYFDFAINKEVNLLQIIKQKEKFSISREMCDVNFQIHDLELTVANDTNLAKEVAAPIIRRVLFDDMSLVIVVAVAGTIDITEILNNGFKKILIEKPRRIVQRHLVLPNEDFSIDQVEKMLNEISEEIDKKGIDFIVPPISKENNQDS